MRRHGRGHGGHGGPHPGHGGPQFGHAGPTPHVAGRHRLQRRLFWWFGATIVVTAIAIAALTAIFRPERSRWDPLAYRAVAETAFAAAWHNPKARRELAEKMAEALHADLTLVDPEYRIIEQIGGGCGPRRGYELVVGPRDAPLGFVHGCMRPHQRGIAFVVGFIAAAGVLWGASLLIARRLTRPLAELVRVTQAIGGGDLAARARLGRQQSGEVGALADSVNEMAARIERQLREERALLAAVSHEIRSPLARLRVLVELAKSGDSERLAQIEAEIVGIDALIGKLLASSRLEFGELSPQRQSAADLARRALESASLPASLLDDQSDNTSLEVDPTLVGRALGNLLENAVTHAKGVETLRVSTATAERGRRVVRFEVLDRGPGFAAAVLSRAFEPFYSARAAGADGSLGLGLALVARIARAHGGRAFAENRSDGGARAGLELPGSSAP